jgi:hypothetical protein
VFEIGPKWLLVVGGTIGAIATLGGGVPRMGKPIEDRVAHAWVNHRKRTLGLD